MLRRTQYSIDRHTINRRDFHRHAFSAALGGVLLGSAPAMARPSEPTGSSQPIIDTHQHLWDLTNQKVPWLKNATPILRRSYVTTDYQEATRGLNVAKAIYMEIDVAPSDHMDEVNRVTKLCKSPEHPTVAAVIGGRPGAPDFESYIRKCALNPFVKGVRQVLHGSTPRGYCQSDEYVQSVRLLGELGLSFDLCMRPLELSDGVSLVDRCPDTRFIVDHCGNADPQAFMTAARRGTANGSHDPDAWRRDMAALAKRKHVICKISGVVARVPKDGWDADDLAIIVDFCLDQFGPDRVVFGSDWPVCLLGAELAVWVRTLKEIVNSRPKADQQKLFHDNAQRLYQV